MRVAPNTRRALSILTGCGPTASVEEDRPLEDAPRGPAHEELVEPEEREGLDRETRIIEGLGGSEGVPAVPRAFRQVSAHLADPAHRELDPRVEFDRHLFAGILARLVEETADPFDVVPEEV